MATLNAGAYGAAGVYYGVGSTPTVWPANMGGGSHGINGFMVGFVSPYLSGAQQSTLKARPVGPYFNVTGNTGLFASRLVASMLITPARIGPAAAVLPIGGSKVWV